MDISFELRWFLYLADMAGVAVFAISGALAAGRKSLDWLGVLIISVVTAVGGGTLRDMLLGNQPVFWIQDPTYLYVIIGATMLTLLYSRYHKPPFRFLLMADAAGLALFAILGAIISERFGVSWIIVVIMGTMTGVAGGIFRDVLTDEVTLIVRRDFYATAAIAGIMLYLLLKYFGLPQTPSAILGMATVISLRLAAIFKGLRLPLFQLPQEPA